MDHGSVIKQDIEIQKKLRKRRMLRKRRFRRRRNICILILVLCVLFFAIKGLAGSNLTKGTSNKVTKENKVSQTGQKNNITEINIELAVVDKPRQRERSEVLKQIGRMARQDKEIADIYENYEKYPDNMLALLANNPETVEFVGGYLDDDRTEKSRLTKAEKKEQYPLFLQWDKRWGYKEYGDSIIGLAGCGPTCLSMVVYALTTNKNITPDVMARYGEKNGYYVDGVGTAWAFMTEGAKHYGLNAVELSLSEEIMKDNLDSGNIIIAAMGPGDFTTSGHFIVIYDYDEDGFKVNDPNCKYRSSINWSYKTLYGQIRMLWTYSAG